MERVVFQCGEESGFRSKAAWNPLHGPRGQQAVCQRFNASRAPFRTVAPTYHVREPGGFLVSWLGRETHTSGFPMKVSKRSR